MKQLVVALGALLVLVGAIVVGIWAGTARSLGSEGEDPWAEVPPPSVPIDHAALIDGPLEEGPDVTRTCLSCHPEAAEEVMATNHWTWKGQLVKRHDDPEPFRVGKANLLNNFCIGVQPNLPRCTTCHAGYGWEDASFDFEDPTGVDCLACHADASLYWKGLAGQPGEGVDLVAAARSVGPPTRGSCGFCHFQGGGGDAVKHGDMDGTMALPSARIDVHMGRHGFSCQDCHQTEDHVIPGCSLGVCLHRTPRLRCTTCHDAEPHDVERLDAHVASVACQTCHIPKMAIDVATKVYWDWSQAGRDDLEEDPHVYLKAKGRFEYAKNVAPEYRWYNAYQPAGRYLTGEPVDPDGVVRINTLCGSAGDPDARIWPVKVHRGRQPYDKVHGHLLIPKTWGEGGYWTEFDWDLAFRLGAEATGTPYSGEYGWVETEMSWPLSHMIQPAERALQCTDCHGENGRMDWEALGYGNDPAYRGGRFQLDLVRGETEPGEPRPLRYAIQGEHVVDPRCPIQKQEARNQEARNQEAQP